MASPLVLSGSSLNIWLECPKQWEFAYVWVVRRPPSPKMALGIAAHYAVEVAMRERLEHGTYPPASVWHDAFLECWEKETKNTTPKNDRAEESLEAYRESGLRCVELYRTAIAPRIVPKAVEVEIAYRLNGHLWTGTVDLVEDLGDGRIRIRDQKFTSRRPDSPRRYRWPMIGYAIGIRQLFDVVEDDIVLDYIIRNKRPVHYPVANGGPVTDADILELAQEVEEAATMIERGDFPPLGRELGTCNWCPYIDICPDADPVARARRKGAKRASID